jgi:hypothetical protein
VIENKISRTVTRETLELKLVVTKSLKALKAISGRARSCVPCSVAVTRAGVFANLWNKIGKILKIFERLDYLRSWWVLCQL